MSVWHEPVSPEINHSFSSKDGRVRAIIRRRDHFGGLNTIHFMRRQEEGRPLNPKIEPDKWVVLMPREEVSEATLDAAKERARGLMEQIGAGQSDDQFEITPYAPPVLPERVAERHHPNGKIKAIVLRWADGRHEVRYYVHELLGVWSNSQTEEWDWVRIRWDKATYADELASAEEIAHSELEELAAVERHPSIRQWFGWIGENGGLGRTETGKTDT